MGSCRAMVSFTKTCQRCGAAFACGGGCCWCDEVALDAGVRRALQERFTDCLCRACLELAAAGDEQRTMGDRGDGSSAA